MHRAGLRLLCCWSVLLLLAGDAGCSSTWRSGCLRAASSAAAAAAALLLLRLPAPDRTTRPDDCLPRLLPARSGIGLAARHVGEKHVATGQVANTGLVSLTYIQRISEKVGCCWYCFSACVRIVARCP